jgi:hypothetical protein
MNELLKTIENMIVVKKIKEKIDFDKIRQNNLDNIAEWEDYYPEHSIWIEALHNDLINHKRIALGAYFSYKKKKILLASIILKKESYSPNIEFKNLSIYLGELPEIVDYISNKLVDNTSNKYVEKQIIKYLYDSLIKRIQFFAESRGIKRTFTELPVNKNEEVNILISNGYKIAGTRHPKYHDSDDLILLDKQINSVVPIDPFDCDKLTQHIIEIYTGDNSSIENWRDIPTENEKKVLIHKIKFSQGRENKMILKQDFNIKSIALIIDFVYQDLVDNEIFLQNFILKGTIEEYDRVYVFDYSSTSSIKDKCESEYYKDKIKYFNHDDIGNLLGDDFTLRKRGLSQNEIGGLLIYEERSSSFIKRAAEFKDSSFGYFLLGGIGRSLTENSVVIFADIDKAENYRPCLTVWAVALSSPAIQTDYMPNEKGNKLADKVFNHIGDLTTIWTKNDFLIHNQFNALDEVTVLPLYEFTDISKSNISSEEFLSINNNKEFISKVYNKQIGSFYLSIEEIKKLQIKIEGKDMTFEIATAAMTAISTFTSILQTYKAFGNKTEIEKSNFISGIKDQNKNLEKDAQELLDESIDQDILLAFTQNINNHKKRFIDAITDIRNNPQQKEQEEAIARKAICKELNMAKNCNGGKIPKVLDKFLQYCD